MDRRVNEQMKKINILNVYTYFAERISKKTSGGKKSLEAV